MTKKSLHERLIESGYSITAIGDLTSFVLTNPKGLIEKVQRESPIIVPGKLVPEVFGPGQFGCNDDPNWYVFYCTGSR